MAFSSYNSIIEEEASRSHQRLVVKNIITKRFTKPSKNLRCFQQQDLNHKFDLLAKCKLNAINIFH